MTRLTRAAGARAMLLTALTLGLWYWLADVPWNELKDAALRIHLSTLGWATGLACVNLCIGAFRCRRAPW